MHNSPLCAHVGIAKTAELVLLVASLVADVTVLWGHVIHASATRKLQVVFNNYRQENCKWCSKPLPIPDRKGGSISMDFVGLPESSLRLCDKGLRCGASLGRSPDQVGVARAHLHNGHSRESTAQLFKDTVIQQIGWTQCARPNIRLSDITWTWINARRNPGQV
jgi:hypothetical protein